MNELATNVNTINAPKRTRVRTNSAGAAVSTDVQKKITEKRYACMHQTINPIQPESPTQELVHDSTYLWYICRRRNTIDMYNQMLEKTPNSKRSSSKEKKDSPKKKTKAKKQQPTSGEYEHEGDEREDGEVGGNDKKEIRTGRERKKEKKRNSGAGISKNTKKRGAKSNPKQNIVEKMLNQQLDKLKERMKKKKSSEDTAPDNFNI